MNQNGSASSSSKRCPGNRSILNLDVDRRCFLLPGEEAWWHIAHAVDALQAEVEALVTSMT